MELKECLYRLTTGETIVAGCGGGGRRGGDEGRETNDACGRNEPGLGNEVFATHLAPRSAQCYSGFVSTTISQRELRNDNARIMRELEEGKTFYITRNSVPIGELTPLRRERLVNSAVAVATFQHSPKIDSDSFFEDIDQVVDQDIEPRG